MIKPLILFIVAYLLVNGILNILNIKNEKTDTANKKWINRFWLMYGAIYFVTAVLILTLFGMSNLHLIIIAAAITGVIHYIVHIKLHYRLNNTLTHYFLYQTIQIGIIYLILLLLGLAGTPHWIFQQFYTLMFAKRLVIDESLIVPTLLLILVFLTHTSSEIIGKFLSKYSNPFEPHLQESAASLEPLLEGSLLTKRKIKHNTLVDMTIEEQVEISNKADDQNPFNTKESIKLQYYWYNKTEDSSKGKYIGILERLLICVFVYYEVYQGLLLIGAMKTLARFKMFENKAFAEYYLIGTLLSLLVAILCGFLLHRILIDATFS
jgi:hypothetical protein